MNESQTKTFIQAVNNIERRKGKGATIERQELQNEIDKIEIINRIEVLKYSIKTTTSLLTKWHLESELKNLEEKNK